MNFTSKTVFFAQFYLTASYSLAVYNFFIKSPSKSH